MHNADAKNSNEKVLALTWYAKGIICIHERICLHYTKAILRSCTTQTRRIEYIYMYLCPYITEHIYIYMYMHIYICIYIYICVYIYMCIHICISMHIETFKFNSVLRLCTPQARRTDHLISYHLLRRHASTYHAMK